MKSDNPINDLEKQITIYERILEIAPSCILQEKLITEKINNLISKKIINSGFHFLH